MRKLISKPKGYNAHVGFLFLIFSYMNYITLMFSPVSHWGILLGGTLIFFILGWLWYSPVTPVGRIWATYFPVPKKENMPKSYEFVIMLILQIFMGFSVTWIVMVLWLLVASILTPLFITFFIVKIYMGFVFIKDIGHWYFEKKPFTLLLISVGYYLIGILGVCGLLGYYL